MAGDRPLESSDHLRKSPSRERGLVSPRLQHFDGDVPPALSPLDAFALQGRLLAKQFDQTRVSGRRLSRLPPSSVARSLSQPRVGYFRSQSDEDARRPARSPGPPEPRTWAGLDVEDPVFRPKSQHPHISGVPHHDVETKPPWDKSFASYVASKDDYGMPRAESPELYARSPIADNEHSNREKEMEKGKEKEKEEKEKEKAPETGLGITKPRQQSSGDSTSTRFYASRKLAPPTPSLGRTSSSHGSFHQESSDDDYYEASSNAGSTFSKSRKMSSSSGVSMPVSPMSHPVPPLRRSPSPKSSDANASPYILQRPSFNFSRPLSRSSTTLSLPSPSTQPRRPSPAPSPVPTSSRTINRNHIPTPITVPEPPNDSNTTGPEDPLRSAGTYIYAKYALPRGRELSRDSTVFSGLQTPHFEWKEPLFEKTPPPSAVQERFARTPSPPPLPAQRSVTPKKLQKPSSAHKSPAAKSVRKVEQSPSPSTRNSLDQSARETPSDEPPKVEEEETVVREEVVNTLQTNTLQTIKSHTEDDAKSTSVRSESTIRPQTSRTETTTKPHAQMTAEEQVAKGISCHENGSLNESTYHFRLAALHNHPTGMLMYALACRHGWGMRPNQQEGVKWLRKAVDSAGLDLDNVNGSAMQGSKNQNIQEQKTRQAQFALSIYELGVSHLKGWGTNQDKPFALRCFEIASHWGDIDALAEAGYCYAEGIGCKKDLKKAAKYYRMAESKGMSMVGNSWIYKDKYMSDDNTVPPPSSNLKSAGDADKKGRNKPRSKSIFGRKKSFAVPVDE